MSLKFTLMFRLFLKINTCHKWINIFIIKKAKLSLGLAQVFLSH